MNGYIDKYSIQHLKRRNPAFVSLMSNLNKLAKEESRRDEHQKILSLN